MMYPRKSGQKQEEVKYKNDFNKQKYDRINLMVPKGKKDELKQLAKEAG